MGVRRFEDLEVWQLARQYSAEIWQVTNRPTWRHDWTLRERMNKTAISIVENVAEGFERESNPEFAQFAKVAKGSTGESRTQLYLAKDRSLLDDADFDRLFAMISSIGKMLRRLRETLLPPRGRQGG